MGLTIICWNASFMGNTDNYIIKNINDEKSTNTSQYIVCIVSGIILLILGKKGSCV